MSNEWDEYAENWDVDPSVEQYAKNAFSDLLESIDINGLTVLDFGCGTGAPVAARGFALTFCRDKST
mgnify:CR=1 FL=1